MAWTPVEVPVATWGVENDGDVDGPASSTDNAIARFNGTTGKIIQDSGVLVDDSNNMSGVVGLTMSGALLTPTSITMAEDGWIGIGASSERIVFDGTGGFVNVLDANVGVGTATPTAILEVAGTVDGADYLKITRGSTSIDFQLGSGSIEVLSAIKAFNIGTGDALAFSLKSNNTARMTVQADGNILIPTTFQLQFRDSATYISSEAANYLDLTAATAITCNSSGGVLEVLDTSTASGGIAKFTRAIDADNEYTYITVGKAEATGQTGIIGFVWDSLNADSYIALGNWGDNVVAGGSVDSLNIIKGGGVGIGTATVPHGGVGAAKLAIEGAVSSIANGPNVAITVSSDDYPTYYLGSFTHDNLFLGFDCYWHTDGNPTSSDATSNFAIRKRNDVLSFEADGGIAQGSALSLVRAFDIEPDAEVLFSPAAARKLYFRDSAISISSQADSYLDFDADGGFRFNTGFFGINKTPSARFDVLGTAVASLTGTNAIAIIDSTATNAIHMGTYSGAPYGVFIQGGNSAAPQTTQYPLILQPNGGNVGIGTTTVPHGGVGAAKLAIEGTNASTAGPHVQFTTASDDYPLMQIIPWAHNSLNWYWDAYYDGSIRSSNAVSNFLISKAGTLNFQAEEGVAAGSAASFVTAFQIESDAEVLFSPSAARKLYFRDAATYIHSNAANYLDLGAASGVRIQADNVPLYFGAGDDASIYYSGSDLYVNPKLVGTGEVIILGGMHLAADSLGTLKFGGGADVSILYDGTDFKLTTDVVAASDFIVDCGTEKTLELAEPVWKDINLGSAQTQLPAASAPSVDTFTDNAAGDTGIPTLAFADGDKVGGTFELQHDYKNGSDITPHIHFQCDAAPSGTDYVKWQMDYTITRDGATMAAVTSIVVEVAVDTQYEQVRANWAAITGTSLLIGDQFSFLLTRITAAGDAYAGTAKLKTVGIHYQCDTIGSRTIGVK